MTNEITPENFKVRLLAPCVEPRRIVLPEGEEPRILKAAAYCAEHGVARPVLLGKKELLAAAWQEVNAARVPDSVELIDPTDRLEAYAEVLCEIRKSKGLTREDALKQLTSLTVVGTMMLHLGEVDGLVSGAIHTTADTIRPALQIIKTAPGAKLVTSLFFICLKEQVLLYGDCAVNPNPTSEALADIARQSARTARLFGFEPRVALLSYSTINSGSGPDVDKVKAAMKILRASDPDFAVAGPLQYDAAVDPGVAALKAPGNPVAGKANVFIFPSLEAGNICYKAVQRSSGAICMGPVLQGLRKPVNDLSRGATVEDIIYTIALTAHQAV